jgi:hypothetical protein
LLQKFASELMWGTRLSLWDNEKGRLKFKLFSVQETCYI